MSLLPYLFLIAEEGDPSEDSALKIAVHDVGIVAAFCHLPAHTTKLRETVDFVVDYSINPRPKRCCLSFIMTIVGKGISKTRIDEMVAPNKKVLFMSVIIQKWQKLIAH